MKIITSIFIGYLLFLNVANSAEKPIPIEISADSLTAQEKKGISVYKGNVVIIQGKLTIRGDKVTIYHPNQKMSKAIIRGAPAIFSTYIEEDKTEVKGQANKITYQAKTKTIQFEGNAKITQAGKNSITGSSIFYDSVKNTIQAKGNPDKQERIKVIFINTGEE